MTTNRKYYLYICKYISILYTKKGLRIQKSEATRQNYFAAQLLLKQKLEPTTTH